MKAGARVVVDTAAYPDRFWNGTVCEVTSLDPDLWYFNGEPRQTITARLVVLLLPEVSIRLPIEALKPL
jgi:hypothetical protein